MSDLRNKLKKLISEQGNLLFGVADVTSFKSYWLELPEKAVKGLNYGISIGLPLSKGVLSSIEAAPTRLYSYHYKQVNYFLDRLGVLVTNFIQAEKYNALPIPASQTIDHAKQKAHLSHRAVAIAAGLGWKGRNNLLVNPLYGSAVRLVTILTDMPLGFDKPLDKGCGNCIKCISLCPAGSIKTDPKEFDSESCYKKLCEFQKIPGIGHHICGICVNACMGN
jgi:epoxyqueuosine reductase QueG